MTVPGYETLPTECNNRTKHPSIVHKRIDSELKSLLRSLRYCCDFSALQGPLSPIITSKSMIFQGELDIGPGQDGPGPEAWGRLVGTPGQAVLGPRDRLVLRRWRSTLTAAKR